LVLVIPRNTDRYQPKNTDLVYISRFYTMRFMLNRIWVS
jgi:hypothetical protein